MYIKENKKVSFVPGVIHPATCTAALNTQRKFLFICHPRSHISSSAARQRTKNWNSVNWRINFCTTSVCGVEYSFRWIFYGKKKRYVCIPLRNVFPFVLATSTNRNCFNWPIDQRRINARRQRRRRRKTEKQRHNSAWKIQQTYWCTKLHQTKTNWAL